MIAVSACFMLVMLSGCPTPEDVVITVTPSEAAVEVDDTTQFNATSTDLFETIAWSSSDENIATIDPGSGVALGVSPGVVKIIATGNTSGQQGSAELTVMEATEDESLAEIDALRDVLRSVPEERLDTDTRAKLHLYLDATEAALFEGEVCEAANWMGGFLADTQSYRQRFAGSGMTDPTWAPDLIYAEGRMLQYNILAEAADRVTCPGYERFGASAHAEMLAGDTGGLEANFSFGAPRMWTVQYDEAERTFTQIQAPGAELETGAPGAPYIPSVGKLVAVPPDSRVRSGYEARIVDQFRALPAPTQEQPADRLSDHSSETEPPPSEVFADRPFVINEQVYAGDSIWPPDPVVVTPMGQYRDLELVHVEVFGGQYDPASQTVSLYDNVRVSLDFNSEHRGFLPAAMADNPFESQYDNIVGLAFNYEAVLKAPLLDLPINPRIFGEEYLILTHPDFRDAADELAKWKNQKGIMTNVFEVGTNTGISGRETNDEIKDYIRQRYETSWVRPSYILLFGDSHHIAPYYRDGMYDEIGTDYPYAVLNEAGEPEPMVPTFAVGRIPVDTQEEAHIVVDKILAYESNPPGGMLTDTPYYNNMTIAAQFQCCRTNVDQVGTAQRTFAEVAEFVRNTMLGEGYNVQRIYQATTDNSYTEDDTPRRYYDGTTIPADIGPNSNFAWDGSRQDVIDAFEDGRFLMIHRDHGWHSGWVHPPFHSNNASNLENAPYLPVVYSINCSSGLFDNETSPGAEGSHTGGVYFAERLLRNPNGGAVGVIGDTRISPSWPNTALLRGLIDATWPNTVPDFGGNTSHRRLGDILNHAKAYLATQIGVSGQGVSQTSYESMMYLYHVLGDPTLEMWTRNPNRFALIDVFTPIDYSETGLWLSYDADDGVEITLHQELRSEVLPVGRGHVEDGKVHIAFFNEPNPDLPLQASANMAGSLAASGEVNLR